MPVMRARVCADGRGLYLALGGLRGKRGFLKGIAVQEKDGGPKAGD